MSGIRDGVRDYRDVTRADQTIKARGDTAFVFNQSTIDIIVRGTPKLVRTRALSVWLREKGSWRLIAVQSGPRPTP